MTPRTWWLAHAGMPLLAFVLAVLALALGDGDRRFATLLYTWEGGRWSLSQHWLLETVLHKGGRLASGIAWLVVLALAIRANLLPAGKTWRRPLWALLLSVLLSTLVVAQVKASIPMDCPWHLARYGGSQQIEIGLWQARPANLGTPRCFPAGHASAGYAWVALYFFFARTRPQWRWHGLATGVIAGLAFGLAQQLRGAHFASHDLWTLAICWAISLCVHRLAGAGSPMPTQAAFSTIPGVQAR